MRRLYYILSSSAIACWLLTLVGCSDDNKINEVVPPLADVTLPQGGNGVADDTIVAWRDRYDTNVLYDFTAEDLSWQLVSGAMFDSQYRYVPINPDSVSNLLAAIREAWLDFYPEEFNRKHLPRFIYLAQKMEEGTLSYSYVEGAFVMRWREKKSRYLDYQIAIANIEGDWAEMTVEQRRNFKKTLQATVLNYLLHTGAIKIPDAFYEISPYGQLSLTAAEARKEGFVPTASTGKDWAQNAINVTHALDIESYLNAIAYFTPEEWKPLYRANVKIRQKYEILMIAFKDYGIDIERIANFE